jgi:hypothetical protein
VGWQGGGQREKGRKGGWKEREREREREGNDRAEEKQNEIIYQNVTVSSDDVHKTRKAALSRNMILA